MKTVKEMRKKINEELTDICVYSDIEKMKTYVLIAIADGIKNSIKENPYCYDYNQNYLFKMSERVNENDILKAIVNDLVNSEYIDNGCKCEYNNETDEYCIKIRLLLYSFTQEEKKKLEIAEQTEKLIPAGFAAVLMIPLILLLLYLLDVTIPQFAGDLIFAICMMMLFLPSIIVCCFTGKMAQKIVKSKW